MKAVDTNLLVYAHRTDAPLHLAADQRLAELIEGETPWAIPWTCIHEFLGIVTHPKIFKPPSTMAAAMAEVESWMESPSIVLIGETPGYWSTLRSMAAENQIAGPKIHDARIAAVCVLHAVEVLWTADRDFSRFSNLRAENPLVS